MTATAFTLVLLLRLAPGAAPAYDPLLVEAGRPATIELSLRDETRSRELQLRLYLPSSAAPAPVVLWSHGLGGSRDGNAYLGRHWAARGYVAIFLQHPGSDEAVWKEEPPQRRMEALRRAANLRNFRLRIGDVRAVLDRLERWNSEPGHPLAGRLDLGRIGMSGHSFGAVTTQAVSGQQARFGDASTDARIRAAVAMSPSLPRGADPARAFGEVKIPWLLMTGTEDHAVIGAADPESRRLVFPALPAGGKYELVLDRAEHSAFSDRPLPGDREARNPNHHRAILALSTAFWDAWLRGDAAARHWLDGDGARGVLEPADRWQRK